ncbi:xanthine dehydrogenase family protein molybdopterin-binding subunit [Maribellus maritimus]|uniref:xanthine dehydrogenase family protein molybdopterin-binding subunit n=1 Tax=Maribellus maritimus TaxID=2870838 RepID=UPI001EEA21EF|nr:molybdopterin cofactor-binding domain-containing protein [Maribellus maritimus]MCG6188842.1 molybdopterin-dependent oxidoreductase [Maribellus maritimus]
MTIVKTKLDRRSFIRSSVLAGGGMLLGFSWLASSCSTNTPKELSMPDEWFEINGFLKIGENGLVTIMSPNPEIGQNVKTSMPMIVAEELDVDWKNVIVEQAPLNTDIFTRQLAGGSQSIRQSWPALRMAGATAREMLRQAAAQKWNVPIEEVSTGAGVLVHRNSNKKIGYGEVASAAAGLPVPEEVELKEINDFSIIGTSRKNVDGFKIVTGQPLFGLDYKKEGMLIAMVAHPPAFGMKLKSFDATDAKAMPGIKDVFVVKTYNDDYELQWSDTTSFNELVAVVGNTTWEVMTAKLMLNVEWEPISDSNRMNVPSGLESTADHIKKMTEAGAKTGSEVRRDGDPEVAFKNAAKIVEQIYTAPFQAHNTMEPMNFFADVKEDEAVLAGPIQTPEFMEKTLAARLGLPLEKIDVQMTRMGGGFGRRLYGHFMVEAAVISQKVKAPVKLVYSREDDMTYGVYRPAYHALYRAALDADNNLIGFHVRMGGIPSSPLHANRFPAGAVDNYLAESWSIDTNISTGAFRAPGSNFNAVAEQSFLDEVAEAAGKDPIQFRLDLLKSAQENPVGERNDYDAARYAGVLEQVREKSGWESGASDKNRGVAAYFCHNSYVANVVDIEMKDGRPVIQKVYASTDCGIVVNPDAAVNMIEGSIVDGIGHAMYSGLTFNEGQPEQENFDSYRLIRHAESPKEIEVHFVKNEIDPTGLGEPPYPPVMGALANALYKATGERYYHQPFVKNTFEA